MYKGECRTHPINAQCWSMQIRNLEFWWALIEGVPIMVIRNCTWFRVSTSNPAVCKSICNTACLIVRKFLPSIVSLIPPLKQTRHLKGDILGSISITEPIERFLPYKCVMLMLPHWVLKAYQLPPPPTMLLQMHIAMKQINVAWRQLYPTDAI